MLIECNRQRCTVGARADMVLTWYCRTKRATDLAAGADPARRGRVFRAVRLEHDMDDA